ncbi:hypothetical protein B4102_2229 [Heyndrickxia sporothermodurans]|uniref:Uncharacterized protein n=1 Tax=Heyndrickxia sporothermodurans TaxID=46224 RepID=A0A150LG71_9BACI|nr:hypothetical protein [Heyndrickxia sporothermodurans]KYD11264.1 hypothetical protein B4102_2229 [Heyndrickxia sporothermodurans]MBL5870677.1 hypothetical protein [Heyndrickxia sporothermodurans]
MQFYFHYEFNLFSRTPFATTPKKPPIAKVYAANKGIEERDSVSILNILTAKIRKLHISVKIIRFLLFIN